MLSSIWPQKTQKRTKKREFQTRKGQGYQNATRLLVFVCSNAKLGLVGVFARTFWESFSQVFSKTCGCGQRPQKRRFFLITFSLRLTPAKKKWLRTLKGPVATAIWRLQTPCPLFSLTPEAQREKLPKEKCPVWGSAPCPAAF